MASTLDAAIAACLKAFADATKTAQKFERHFEKTARQCQR